MFSFLCIIILYLKLLLDHTSSKKKGKRRYRSRRGGEGGQIDFDANEEVGKEMSRCSVAGTRGG